MAAACCLSRMKFRGIKGIPAKALNQLCPLPLTESQLGILNGAQFSPKQNPLLYWRGDNSSHFCSVRYPKPPEPGINTYTPTSNMWTSSLCLSLELSLPLPV